VFAFESIGWKVSVGGAEAVQNESRVMLRLRLEQLEFARLVVARGGRRKALYLHE